MPALLPIKITEIQNALSYASTCMADYTKLDEVTREDSHFLELNDKLNQLYTALDDVFYLLEQVSCKREESK